jgi:phospholipid/cholesterol/gamma-HCH transport system permease protein
MNFIKRFLLELQEITVMTGRSFASLLRSPRYPREIITQMDLIGVGSLPIILLTGLFTGGVLVVQITQTLAYYGSQGETGKVVSATLVRELGPVLTALMVAGRVGSSISAELGSMVVSQQIDAMRALGTDPIRKLVTPRIIALIFTLPLLTGAADIIGLIGGGVTAYQLFSVPQNVWINAVRTGITTDDVIGGIIKPLIFGLIISVIACYKGLTTEGGTAGVGRSTTSAVVLASIWVIIADFFLSRILQVILEQI